jgi:hypothetical protein
MTIANNAIVSRYAGFSPLFGATHQGELSRPNACAMARFGRTVNPVFRPVFQEKDQT